MNHPLNKFITHDEIDAFLHRLHFSNECWKEYTGKIKTGLHTPNDIDSLITLRDKIVIFIHVVVKDYEKLEHANKFDEFKYEVFQKLKKGTSNNPFVLDFGSMNPSSDVDLTIMNVSSRLVVPFILHNLNETFSTLLFKTTFSEKNIKQLFDISFYLNSFLFVKRDKLVYMICHDPITTIQQRVHAKHRLRVENEDITNRGDVSSYDIALQRRNRSVINDSCNAENETSILTYFQDDAYHSKGGFVHVLLEIQNGTRLKLSRNEYLNSAFENLGMLKHTWNGDSSLFCKYGARTVHALKRVCECSCQQQNINVTNHESEQVIRLVKEIIAIYDKVSVYNNKQQYLKYSIGVLSQKHQVKQHIRYNFESIFLRKSNSFYVPGRIFASDMKAFIHKIKVLLSSLEQYIA